MAGQLNLRQLVFSLRRLFKVDGSRVFREDNRNVKGELTPQEYQKK